MLLSNFRRPGLLNVVNALNIFSGTLYFSSIKTVVEKGSPVGFGSLATTPAKTKKIIQYTNIMSWATHYIEKLKNGETVQFRPRGNSMKGKIDSGQLVTVAPVGGIELKKGDIVLCKVNGSQYLHLIKAIQGERYQIGNNIGRINGWITQNFIYGICTGVSA